MLFAWRSLLCHPWNMAEPSWWMPVPTASQQWTQIHHKWLDSCENDLKDWPKKSRTRSQFWKPCWESIGTRTQKSIVDPYSVCRSSKSWFRSLTFTFDAAQTCSSFYVLTWKEKREKWKSMQHTFVTAHDFAGSPWNQRMGSGEKLVLADCWMSISAHKIEKSENICVGWVSASWLQKNSASDPLNFPHVTSTKSFRRFQRVKRRMSC